MPTWSVLAWVQAPGEFPSYAQQRVGVPGKDITAAVAAATARFERTGLNPVIVSVVRVRPPLHESP